MKLRTQGCFDQILRAVGRHAKPLVVVDVTICSHGHLAGVGKEIKSDGDSVQTDRSIGTLEIHAEMAV
jgi:hypothetical protein